MRNIRIVLTTTVVWLAAFAALWYAVNTPLVEFSTARGECLRVLVPSDGTVQCGNLPRRYEVVWTQ